MGWDSQGKYKKSEKTKKKFGVSVVWWRVRGPDLTLGFASTPFASLMTEDKVPDILHIFRALRVHTAVLNISKTFWMKHRHVTE